MDDANTSSPSLPSKSKKTLCSVTKSLLEDHQSLNSKTPEKPAEQSSRTRNRKIAFSIKEVRPAAESVCDPNRQQPRDRTAEGSESVRRPIDSWQNGSPSSRSKASLDNSKELPEKFEILSKFFNSLDSAMRLLRLKGLTSIFSNVCPKIEVLTDRRFSFGHLAQLKFLLPEAIELKKVHVLDEWTSCTKPDLHITFNFDVLDNQDDLKTGTQHMQLRKLFRARLSDFVSSNPEIDDVPKELLPKPFNCPSQDLFPKTNSLSTVKTSVEQLATSSTHVAEEMPFSRHHAEESQGFRIVKSMVPITVTGLSKQKEFIGASHFSQFFSRRFSQKFVNREMEKTDQATNPCDQRSCHSDAATNFETKSCITVSSSKLSSPVKLHPNSTYNSSCLENYASPTRNSTLFLPSTPSNMAGKVTVTNEDDPSAKTNDFNSTPAKLVSTPARLMASTPVMAPPKRSSMSPDDYCSTNKLIRRPPRSRTLVFDTPTKDDENMDEIDVMRTTALDGDIFDVLPQSHLQSIREKESKAKEEQRPAISQAKRRQQMIDNLPKLLDDIFLLFHTRTIITKEELIYKMIVGNADIVDRREVEEQLDLLLELVPEWISEKLAASGDVQICIDKVLNAETIRARLEEAR